MEPREAPGSAEEAPDVPATAARRWAAAGGKLLRRCGIAVWRVLQFLLIIWAALAIYYSNLPWAWARIALAVAFAGFAVWALWVTRRPRMGWAFAAAFAGVVIWFASIRPSHDRPWRPDVAVMPRAYIDGDHVRIEGVRDFDFRTRYDFTPRYETREFLISHVNGLDLFISYWWPGPIAHTFVSFRFDDGTPPLCISIETRPEKGQSFAPIASMFKQFELIYVVGEERDLVGSRAAHRNEQVYLYPVRATPAGVRRLLRIYLDRINQLADHPEFYHLLSNNCTVNIFRYARAAGSNGGFSPRELLNGWVDGYLYEAGLLDRSRPFSELRRQSRITDVAKAAANAGADPADFSHRIREFLPGRKAGGAVAGINSTARAGSGIRGGYRLMVAIRLWRGSGPKRASPPEKRKE